MLTLPALLMLQLVTPITVASSPPHAAPSAPQTTPVPVGLPHKCAPSQYPVAAMQKGAGGKTVLKFAITSEGRVKNISVDTSSGNADLDAATVTCVGDWTYRPATKNGAAVEVPWKAAVDWKFTGSTGYPLVDFRILLCMTADRPSMDEFVKAPMHPVVRVHYANGAITNVTLAGTSGNSDVDNRVLACYRTVPAELTAKLPDGDEVFAITLPSKVEVEHF